MRESFLSGRVCACTMLLLSAVAFEVSAQWRPVRHLKVIDGLVQSQITDITHDRDGYLWFATLGGVSRWDGHHFTNFSQSEGMKDVYAHALATGPDGAVWWITESRQAWRYEKGRLESLGQMPGDTLPWPRVYHLTARRGRLIAAAQDGLWQLVPELGWRRLDERRATSIVDHRGELLVSIAENRRTQIFRVDGDRLERRAVPERLEDEYVLALFSDGERLIYGTNDGAIWEQIGDEEPQLVVEGLGRVLEVVPGVEGEFWASSGQVLWQVVDGEARQQPLRPLDTGLWTTALHRDREGGIWAGTEGDGAYLILPDGVTVYSEETGAPFTAAWSFVDVGEGCVAVVTDGQGLFRVCDEGRQVERDERLPVAAYYEMSGDAEELWVSDASDLYRLRSQEVVSWDLGGTGFVQDVFPDGKGGALLATDAGLFAVEPGGEQAVASDLIGEPTPLVAFGIESAERTWLVSGFDGIWILGRDSVEHLAAGDSAMPEARLLSADVGDEWLWVGTEVGLWSYSLAGGEGRLWSLAELPSAMILWVVDDGSNGAWIGTTHGLAHIDAEARVLRFLDDADGLPDIETTQKAALKDSRGRIWSGLAWGTVLLDPSRMSDPEVAPQLVLEDVIVDGVGRGIRLSTTDDKRGSSLHIGAEERDIHIRLAAPTTLQPRRLTYRYQLQGLEGQVNITDEGFEPRYRHLEAGSYRFVATAAVRGGPPSEPLELEIIVEPPWYQTWPARLGFASTGLLFFALAMGGWTLGQRRRSLALEHLVSERTAELASANTRITQQNRLLEELSRTDPLTGLDNRRVLAEQLPLAMALAHRQLVQTEDPAMIQGLGVYILDLDHFKQINDEWGHDVGDRMLRAVADGIRTMLREVDLAVRWGGEEFVVLGRGLDRAGIERLARRLLEVVAASRVEVQPGQRLSTTASAGFVYYPIGRDGRGSWRDVLEISDRLMYRAKRDGRGRAYGLVWNELDPPEDPESLLMGDLLAEGAESSANHEIVLVTMGSAEDDV